MKQRTPQPALRSARSAKSSFGVRLSSGHAAFSLHTCWGRYLKAVAEKDNGSRDLFVKLLKDEEDHVDWLEAQVHQIGELGYERYLTMQMGELEE